MCTEATSARGGRRLAATHTSLVAASATQSQVCQDLEDTAAASPSSLTLVAGGASCPLLSHVLLLRPLWPPWATIPAKSVPGLPFSPYPQRENPHPQGFFPSNHLRACSENNNETVIGHCCRDITHHPTRLSVPWPLTFSLGG